MILAALNDYYDRLADRGEVPPYGYTSERISFCIVLRPDGSVSEVMDLRPDGKTARTVSVPASCKRPGTIPKSFFLWDNTKMIFGLTMDKTSKQVCEAPKHRQVFQEYHEQALSGSDDEGLLAFLEFIRVGRNEVSAHPETIKHAIDSNLVFMLEGDRDANGKPRYLHDRPAARDIWSGMVGASEGAEGTCLVTGKVTSIARIHPTIKGVMGAKSSGASLVSFNGDTFESHGYVQGLNAPVSESAAASYGAALNQMLSRDSGHRLQIGDATTVFWADASGVGEDAAIAAENTIMSYLSPPMPDSETEQAKIRDALAEVAKGRAIADLSPEIDRNTKCFLLGLSPVSSRLAVRFWMVDSFDHFAAHIQQHWQDLYIEPYPWRTGPAAWALLYETAVLRKAENIPPLLGGEVMRSILTGSRYPRTLLSSVIIRIRADGELSGARAAIIKACLQRDARMGNKEEVPVSLNKDDPNPAYRLGRLFAVLEGIQKAALGPKINATIRDKYFASASATPASVFPVILRGAQNHLAALRKLDKAGWYEREIAQILEAFGSGFPRTLNLEDQGRYAVGYYHQRFTYTNGKTTQTNGTEK